MTTKRNINVKYYEYDKVFLNISDFVINDVNTNCIKMSDNSKYSNCNRLQKIFAWMLPC